MVAHKPATHRLTLLESAELATETARLKSYVSGQSKTNERLSSLGQQDSDGYFIRLCTPGKNSGLASVMVVHGINMSDA